MNELNRLSLTKAAALISSGQIKPSELIDACAQRIEQREPEVQAFQYLDLNSVTKNAQKLDSRAMQGDLLGIPVGIKDIIDTADMPTTMGSPIYARHQPQFDAVCVNALRYAGAVILGKTVTTEFACFHPGKTRNPHNLSHTPGGSSMGSAAAVADFMLPVAIGSQTAASVIRPAAYCGVVGYKSSQGEFSLSGILSLSQTMDSLGFFVREVADLSLLRRTLLAASPALDIESNTIRLGLVRTPHWDEASTETQLMIESSAKRLEQSGAIIEEINIGRADTSLAAAQKVIMAYELCRARAWEYTNHRQLLSEPMIALIESGLVTSFDDYQQAQKLAADCYDELKNLFQRVDALIAPSAAGEAPKGLSHTGDPLFSRMWNVLRVPSITIPVGTGANNLPLGLQVIGQHRHDDELIQITSWIHQRLTR